MGNRRKAREISMQALFGMDITNNHSEQWLELFCKSFPPVRQSLPFFQILVNGVINNINKIDQTIERFSNKWKLSRMSGVDRNLLRIAVYEMLFCSEIPASVSINEAIEISKKFGTPESGKFINGILDSIRIYLEE